MGRGESGQAVGTWSTIALAIIVGREEYISVSRHTYVKASRFHVTNTQRQHYCSLQPILPRLAALTCFGNPSRMTDRHIPNLLESITPKQDRIGQTQVEYQEK